MRALRHAPHLFAIAVLASTSIAAQEAAAHPGRDVAPGQPVILNCQAIAGTGADPRLDLVVKLWDFVNGYQHQLPNFIVQQTTTFESGSSKTVMTAEVSFQKGLESYSHVTVNG